METNLVKAGVALGCASFCIIAAFRQLGSLLAFLCTACAVRVRCSASDSSRLLGVSSMRLLHGSKHRIFRTANCRDLWQVLEKSGI